MRLKTFLFLAILFTLGLFLVSDVDAQMSEGELWKELDRAAIRADDNVGGYAWHPGTDVFLSTLRGLRTTSQDLQATWEAIDSPCQTLENIARKYRLDCNKLLGNGWRAKFLGSRKPATRAHMREYLRKKYYWMPTDTFR